VKNLLRRAQLSECRRFVAEALKMRTAAEIREALQDMVLRVFPEEFKFFDPEALQPKYRSGEQYV
jgi:phosphotransferase system enzyme I (PtsI)